MKTAEKFADGFSSYTTFEAKDKQRRNDQTDEPGVACFRFPKPRLRIAISALDGLEMTMHTAFGKTGLFGSLPNALFAVVTNRVENHNTFGPQSHGVAPSFEGWLKL
jgi:hypothetical protein